MIMCTYIVKRYNSIILLSNSNDKQMYMYYHSVYHTWSQGMKVRSEFQHCGWFNIMLPVLSYRKWGKIRWAKLSCFSWFSGVPQKFFREYKHHSLIVLNNEHLWPRQCKNISVKTLIALKPQIFSPANLSPSTVCNLAGLQSHLASWLVRCWKHK